MSHRSRLQALVAVLLLLFGLTSIANSFAPPPCGPATAAIRNGTGKNPVVLLPTGVPTSPSTWNVNVNVGNALAGTEVVLFLGRECLPTPITTPYGQYLIKNELGFPTAIKKIYPGNSLPVTFSITIPPNACGAYFCLQALVKPISPFRPGAWKTPYWTNAISGFTGA